MINELLFIIVMLLSLSTVLIFLRLGRLWLMVLPAILLLLANIFAPHLVIAFGINTSIAIPLYAAIFLATDIISEHWGKKAARRVVWMGFAAQILLLVFSQLIIRGAPVMFSVEFASALTTVFAFTPRIVAGSLIAYVISQTYDVWMYHILKKWFKGSHMWIRNNVSTITSQFIDITLFASIAFYGVMPNFSAFLFSWWIMKVVVAVVDTPFIYLSKYVIRKNELRTTLRAELA